MLLAEYVLKKSSTLQNNVVISISVAPLDGCQVDDILPLIGATTPYPELRFQGDHIPPRKYAVIVGLLGLRAAVQHLRCYGWLKILLQFVL